MAFADCENTFYSLEYPTGLSPGNEQKKENYIELLGILNLHSSIPSKKCHIMNKVKILEKQVSEGDAIFIETVFSTRWKYLPK